MAGRPKLRAKDRKADVIRMRVTADESRTIKANAQKAGYETVSEWLRKIALREKGKPHDD